MGVGGIIAEMDHSSELQTRLRQDLNYFIGTQHYARMFNTGLTMAVWVLPQLISIYKLTYGHGFHSYELKSTQTTSDLFHLPTAG